MKLTKQQQNCPYCHEKGADHHVKAIEDTPDQGMGLTLEEDGWHVWTYDLDNYKSLRPINYCPQCGRLLNEEEE